MTLNDDDDTFRFSPQKKMGEKGPLREFHKKNSESLNIITVGFFSVFFWKRRFFLRHFPKKEDTLYLYFCFVRSLVSNEEEEEDQEDL